MITFEGLASSGKALALGQRGERRGGGRRRRGKHQLCRIEKGFNDICNLQRHLVSISAILSDFASESLSSLRIVTACCLVSSTRSDTCRFSNCKDGKSILKSFSEELISKDDKNLLLQAQLVRSRHGIPHI